ncbi:protein stoned-B-like [Toxorhynchites rutilus septentrionalis]|uniref:protein stoned-B-like n=1 Tax=Toxorhynchites rutilus septentrionalis TaxID=329112 RepID=UPI002479E5A2|nr:protein stoned-B-like [Toxorhynchites rutilus septentrionalis]
MANPFLMDNEPMGGNEPVCNPFLFGDDAQDDAESAAGVDDNPFLAQASNPFADFGGEAEEPAVAVAPAMASMNDLFGTAEVNAVVTTGAEIFGVSDSVMSVTHHQTSNSAANFFDTTINDDDDLVIPKPMDLQLGPHTNNNLMDDAMMQAYSSEDELKSAKGNHKMPPPRPIPPSQATQQLISSIASQLDQTSTNLLQKIPATRTPSPVSMRDLHSPSPTPEFGDLLSAGDQLPHSDSQPQDNFFGTGMTPVGNDNPFADPVVPIAAKPEVQKPPRPRPPPPRPAPPKSSLVSSPVAAPQPIPAPQQEADLFDLFGTTTSKTSPPKPPAHKTKEDILSLFSTPTVAPAAAPEPKQTDLLSGDFDDIFGGTNEGSQAFIPYLSENLVQSQMPPPPPEATTVAAPSPATAYEAEVVEPSPIQQEPPVSCEPPVEIEQPHVEQQPEFVFDVAPPAECMTIRSEGSTDPSPTGSNVTSSNIPSSVSGSIVNIAADEMKIDEALPEMNAPMEPSMEPSMEPTIDDHPMMVVQDTHNHVDALPPVAISTIASQLFYTEPDVTTAAMVTADSGAINPFAMEDDVPYTAAAVTVSNDYANDLFGNTANNNNTVLADPLEGFGQTQLQEPDAFDSFAAKFEGTHNKGGNIFLDGADLGTEVTADDAFGTADAWGTGEVSGGGFDTGNEGFGNDDGFDDPFLTMQAPPVPEGTPFGRSDSRDSDEGNNQFSVVIRPKEGIDMGLAPALAPPPKSPQTASIYSGDSSPRVNPFDRGETDDATLELTLPDSTPQLQRTDSQETPPTPLFDEDVSQPLEDFPRVVYSGEGWEMQLRQPNKKKITGQRFWKKIYIRLVVQGDNPVLQLSNAATDKEPFQELPLQACYSVSEISSQQYDNFGKIFTIKLQYVFYKERPGVRPGQVTKAERLTNKLSQFAAYAIQGDYQGVKELGSDLKKLGLPVEHAPQISQLFKLGSMNYEDMKQFSVCIEEALFKMNVHRDRALTYKTEEVQVTAVDELYVEQDAEGRVNKQIARVRLFFLAFLSGMPDIELGVNDLWRQGKEVVGRHDIIPVVTEEWIRLEGVEFHGCVQQDEYERSRTIKFKPPDACYIELMRFRIRPPKNRELPLQLKATWCVTGNKVELRADVLVPGFASRKLGQIPCEDVSIRFPIPECWIYLFRVEKHFRYGSVKSAHRRTGKIKGIERLLGTMETLQESLIEVTSGQAKYEHNHRAIVWRCPRLPKEGQGAYTTHQLVCRMALTSFDQIPEQLAPYAYVEFTMPATQASHTTVRSISVQDSESDEPPEKYVRYLARHEYRVGIEHTTSESLNPYLAATTVSKPIQEEQPMATTPIAPSDSDSDSN